MGRRVLVYGAIGVAVVAASVVALLTLAPEQADHEHTLALDMTAARFLYEPANFTVEQGTEVVLRITSTDVTHGFSIPEFGVDVRIPPGEPVTVRFTPDRSGTFEYFCTVFCGSGHPQHRGTITVTA